MKYWLFLLIAVVSEVIGTSALKSAVGFTKPLPVLVVIVAFGSAFYFLSLTLKVIPIGVAYAVWSGLGIVFISLIGKVYFKQVLDTPALIGIGLILVGVIIMQVFSKSIGH